MAPYDDTQPRNSTKNHTATVDFSSGRHERVVKFYNEVHTKSARHWPGPKQKRGDRYKPNPLHTFEQETRSNPYAFAWDTLGQNNFTRMLMTVDGKKQYPPLEVLRVLLYRFRVAPFPRPLPLPEMKGFRWRYVFNEELELNTGQSARQRRDSVKFLTDRGLVVKVYKNGYTKAPFYRPSDDLFRVCLKFTQLSDGDFLSAWNGGRKLPPEEKELFDIAHQRIFREHHAEIAKLCAEFMASKDGDRATLFCQTFDAWTDEYWPDFEILDDE